MQHGADGIDGFLKGYESLIHDRDQLFTAEFRRILRDVNVKRIQLPRRSPNLNAFAERFVGSIKHGCLGQMIFFSKSSLKYAGVQGESQWWLSLEDGQAYINEFQRLIDEEHGQGSWSGTRLIRFLRAYTGKHVESDWLEDLVEHGIPNNKYEIVEAIVDNLIRHNPR